MKLSKRASFSISGLMLLVSLTGWNLCQALPEDREQAIEINADRAVRNDKTGVTEFVGNALLSQGSLSIAADSITINQNSLYTKFR